jgi:peptidoglycan/LPS O-acetylase OafA/YrhL
MRQLGRASGRRQLMVVACLGLALTWSAVTQAQQTGWPPARPLWQESPLSPLPTLAPTAAVTMATATGGNPISLVLVGLVFVGLLLVIGLVAGRRQ